MRKLLIIRKILNDEILAFLRTKNLLNDWVATLARLFPIS